MAAYAALVSLMQIIHQIEHHPFPPISMDKKQVVSLTEMVMFLQEFLEGYESSFADGDEPDPLEMRIADAVYAAEDVIESHIVDQILPAASEVKRDWIGFFNCFQGLKEPKNNSPTSVDLYESMMKVIEDMFLIKKEVMEIMALKDITQIHISTSSASLTSSIYSPSNLTSTVMVGIDDALLELMDKLTDARLDCQVIPIVGMAGIGVNWKHEVLENPLRDLCLREAQKERFYDVVGQHSPQGTYSQRRVVILRSTPEGKVIDAMKSRPYARTCICDGERILYVPDLRLLRTLKAHNKDFYPQGHDYSLGKLFELVNLRLLIVKSDRYPQLPSSINLLWSLQTLIVCGSIGRLNAPVEIWNMPQLRHVHFWRRALHLRDTPSGSIVIMENLRTLKGVKNFKCDETMVRRIPNIKKLGLYYYINVRTESRDDDYCVYNIKHLQKLESFRCKGYARGDLLGKLTFPHSIKSLTLDFKHYSMEDVLEKVSTLPFLQKLKLNDGRFQTKKWETVEDTFPSLKYLLLGSCFGLECWVMESSHFPCLEHLYLYKMSVKEIPAELGEIPTLKSVILDDCSESVVKSAKKMVDEQEELQEEELLSFKVEVRLRRKKEELQKLANPNFQVNTDW
ncbi:putative late blight resistance protein homolog R1B-14 isoform X1 [Salvia hispanica]|uniref:putative late blight resistance protein homolog R1B-14 isoform X1 n=1 Tax=Salvia hispanica TaxID=49212 RepID=UPI00200910F4|nr:putative late blight resistance protein homolog R1B-14 isoform X1 [Salvia hispanica]